MLIKDYYKILNIKPDASFAAIKQSYRKLAMQYHPDKNPDDELSAAVFSEIAEAYSVLNNPAARKEYNYQRYHTAISEYTKPAESIESLINKAAFLKSQLIHIDPFRFNREALLYSIQQLLPNDISLLLKTNETDQTDFLQTIFWFGSLLQSSQQKSLYQSLQPLFSKHTWLQQKLNALIKKQIKKERWEKYKIVLAVVLTILLCAIIFFSTKN